jgi:hypothetical protein
MKNFYLLTIVLFLSVGIINAQPVITYGNHAPQIGDQFTISSSEGSYDPGPAGANQSWDFSNITASMTTTSQAVSPAGTPFASEFTESNLCFSILDEDVWNYANVSNSAFENNGIGVQQDPEDFVIHYSDPQLLVQYPFAYGDNFTDTYYASYSVAAGLETKSYGTAVVEADAWGSIVTPLNTYSSSLRVKTTTTEIDSTFVGGMLISTLTTTNTDYSWYVANVKPPVVTVNVYDGGSSASYLTSAVGIEDNRIAIEKINIYPNPATDYINISFEEFNNEVDVLIYNQLGQLVIKDVVSSNYFKRDISELNAGIYFLRIIDDSENVSTSKIVKR